MLPFGTHDQRIGTVKCRLWSAHQTQACFISVQTLSFLHGFRVEGTHLGASGPQGLHQYAARRIAHVIGVGFECQAPQGKGFAFKVAFVIGVDTLKQFVFLAFVDGLNRLQQIAGAIDLLRAVDQRAHVFGKARAAVATTGVDEVIANAGIRANTQAHSFDISA